MKISTAEAQLYNSRDVAVEAARRYNRATVANRRDLRVVVEGPEETGHWWTMDLREAVDNGFSYSWSAS